MTIFRSESASALLLADRQSLLSRGNTLQSGVPRAVMAQPVNQEAARLIGIRNLFEGQIERHDPDAGLTWLRAGELRLACRLSTQWAEGSRICWMVPDSGVRVRALSRNELPAGNNRVSITIRTLLTLGDDARLTASLPGLVQMLHWQVPQRLVEELRLQPGASTDVLLRQDSLHILPVE